MTNKYRDAQGRLLYDIQLEDGDKEITGVTNDQLEVGRAHSLSHSHSQHRSLPPAPRPHLLKEAPSLCSPPLCLRVAVCVQLQSEYVAEASSVFVKANCLCKLICDSAHDNRVVGLHFLGPNAGEVVQGFALAVQMGATKQHFDNLVGIHPTAAEEFAVLEVEKSSDSTPLKKAGCGGGSCG